MSLIVKQKNLRRKKSWEQNKSGPLFKEGGEGFCKVDRRSTFLYFVFWKPSLRDCLENLPTGGPSCNQIFPWGWAVPLGKVWLTLGPPKGKYFQTTPLVFPLFEPNKVYTAFYSLTSICLAQVSLVKAKADTAQTNGHPIGIVYKYLYYSTHLHTIADMFVLVCSMRWSPPSLKGGAMTNDYGSTNIGPW